MEKVSRAPRRPADRQNQPEIPGYMRQSGRYAEASHTSSGTTQSRAPRSTSTAGAGTRTAGSRQQATQQRPAAASARTGASSSRSTGSAKASPTSRSTSGSRSASGARSTGSNRSTGSSRNTGNGGGGNGQRPPQRNGNGGNNGNGGKRKKRVTRAQKLMRLALGIFGALVLVIGGILLVQHFSSPAGEEPGGTTIPAGKKFVDGVRIEGVDVSDKTAEEVKPLVQQAVSTRMGAVSYVLTSGEKSWSITAADLNLSADVDELLLEALSYGRGGSMSENADAKQLAVQSGKDFQASFALDRQSLINRLNEIAGEANRPPVEPSLIPSLVDSNGQFVQNFEPVQGENGRVLNAEATADAIEALVQSNQYDGALEPVYDDLAPSMSIDYLLANTQRISTFSTNYATSSSNETVKNRCFNIQKASDRINGYVLQPGEEFTFNGWVGPRTKETGWAEANGISGGKEYTLQYGGGICQVSTTLYGAVLRANLSVTERHKHSIPSDYVPYGLDATVDTSGKDLKFVNNTDAPIYIFSYIKTYKEKKSRLEITVSLYGKALPDGVTYTPVNEIIAEIPNDEVERVDDSTIPVGYEVERFKHRKGYEVEVYMVKNDNGAETRERLYKDTYRGNKQRILVGTGDPAKVSPPEGAKPVGSIGMTEDTTPGDTSEPVPEAPPAAPTE